MLIDVSFTDLKAVPLCCEIFGADTGRLRQSYFHSLSQEMDNIVTSVAVRCGFCKHTGWVDCPVISWSTRPWYWLVYGTCLRYGWWRRIAGLDIVLLTSPLLWEWYSLSSQFEAWCWVKVLVGVDGRLECWVFDVGCWYLPFYTWHLWVML